MGTYATKKVWVVNCYFDELRLPVARSLKLPQSMAPVYLAGAFNTDRCDVRLWNEQTAGPLQEKALLEGTDILVLSGMTNAFDRMLQLTACVKTLNPRAVVIAGGPAIRALPKLSAEFFDEICTGDAEQLRDVVRAVVGTEYVSERMTPRYELGDWVKNSRFGYAESTRNCNFRCSFCTMTAENRAYQKLSLDALREQILAQGKKDVLIFLDNNFYGNDRSHFTQRLELLKDMRATGHFNGWAALVTNDFFAKDENLQLAKESGCVALFSGFESFDAAWLRSQGKKQNTVLPQLELIRRCHAHGIVFMYGLMLDVNTRSLQELRDEIEFILSRPEISLPSYLSIPIPILNTPIFHNVVRENKFLPHVKLRDMDSTTLTKKTREPLDQCATFVRELQTLDGQWGSVMKHTLGFVRRHATQFSIKQHLIALSNPVMLTVGHALSTLSWKASSAPRTHIATTEKLDACYTPPFTIASEYEHYYRPTYVTDSRGALSVEMDELNRNATHAGAAA